MLFNVHLTFLPKAVLVSSTFAIIHCNERYRQLQWNVIVFNISHVTRSTTKMISTQCRIKWYAKRWYQGFIAPILRGYSSTCSPSNFTKREHETVPLTGRNSSLSLSYLFMDDQKSPHFLRIRSNAMCVCVSVFPPLYQCYSLALADKGEVW